MHQSRNVMKYIYFVTYLPCDRPAKMQFFIHVLLQYKYKSYIILLPNEFFIIINYTISIMSDNHGDIIT